MDIASLTKGQKIAGASAIALLLIMSVFDWFGDDFVGLSAWQSFQFIDLVLLLAAVAAIALAVTGARSETFNLPVSLSAVTTGLGLLGVLLILFRILSPPDFGIGDALDAAGLDGGDADIGRKIGVFLGLIAAGGVAYGGWTAMQEEGTSFSEERDRIQTNRDPGGPPPPPAV